MFKLVVLSALVAIAAAKPHLVGAPLAYSAQAVAVAAPVAVPAAVSHQYRTDVVSKPVVATYAHTPVVAAAPVVAAPVVQRAVVAAAPVVQSAVYAAPISSAVSHQSRVDVHSGLVAAAPVAYAAHHIPTAYAAHHIPAAVHAW